MNDLSGYVTKGYQLTDRIGAGGFGAVYRAYQSAIGREVAIKVILPEYANQPEFIRRFETEAQLVARLEHPFIVPLFDYWRDPDGAYLVMRLFKGGSLREILEKQGKFAPDRALKLIDQIAGALAVAHRNGVVHRDLKPDNILMDEDDNAFLTDFGIAKVIKKKGDDEEEEGISGSPGYISPEQIISDPVTPRTDIYSLGVVMYEVLTGLHPFGFANTGELILKHLHEPIPDLSIINDELPWTLNDVVQKATAKDPEDRYADVLELARAFRQAMSNSLGGDVLVTFEDDDILPELIVNPYKGLRSFEEADAADFFGREVLTTQLIQRMNEPHEMARFLAVVGPSGSGKSSVVKAGLVPALRWGDVAGSESWFFAEMIPGVNPLQNLESTLLSVSPRSYEGLIDKLKRDQNGLLDAVDLLLPDSAELLLVIDQFEEVFTLLDSEQERTHFLALIREAITAPNSRVRIIVTLRADFYDRPLLYEGFGSLMRLRTEVVLPLSTEELERAITGPAERVGLMVDSNLLAAIVSDVREEPGALPLLQYVLTEVFERREGRYLTLNAYQESGGALGALARRADELYVELEERYQAIVRQLFLRLVTLGEGTEDTRRRVQWGELTSFGVNRDDLQTVLDAFGKYRLLSFDHDTQTREPTVEVAHEALIREWQLLREWLSASREDVRLQRSLGSAAQEWIKSGQEASFLIRGTRLTQYEEWADETDLVLTADERRYLEVSIAQRLEQEAREAERLAREQALERTSRNRLRILVAVLGVAFVVALGLSALAFVRGQEAQVERDNAQTQVAIASTAVTVSQAQEAIAQREASLARSLALAANARQLYAIGEYQTALVLALEANMIDSPPAQVQQVLANVAYAPGMARRISVTAPIESIAYSPDNRHFATGHTSGQVIVWDSSTGEEVQRFEEHNLPAASVAYSPDGERIVSGSWDRMVMVWDVASGERLYRLQGHQSTVSSVAYSPDGQLIVSGALDKVVVWDAETGENLREIPIANVMSLAISNDSEIAFVGSQNADLAAVNLQTGLVLRRFRGHTSDVLSVALSPAGDRAVSSSRDGSLILWDFDDARQLSRFDGANGHSLSVNSVAFSHDGQKILTASDDHTLIVWSTDTYEVERRFEGHRDAVMSAVFSNNSQTFVSGARDNTLIMWSMGNGALIATLDAHTAAVNGVVYSPDGMRAASASNDQTVIVWDIPTGEYVQLEGHTDAVMAVAFSSDGERLVSGANNGRAIIWNLADGQPIQTISAHNGAVNSVAFHPDGEWVLTGGDDNLLVLWSALTGERVRSFTGHVGRVLSVTISPDGRTVLSGSADRTMRLWNIENEQMLQLFSGHARRVLSVTYSPVSGVLASGSDDGNIILWNVQTPAEPRRLIRDESTPVLSLTFNPTGDTLISGFEGGDIVLWDVTAGQPIRIFDSVGQVVAVSSVAFSPDGLTVLASLRNGLVQQWLMPPLEGLIAWTNDNRVLIELNCETRVQYGLQTDCATP